MNYLYAFFLIFITPLSVPLAVWTCWQGWVSGLDIAFAIGMYCLSGLGITLGYHRLVTHRSYQAKPWLKYFLLVCGTFAMQGGPASWASLHIQHHRFADKPGDPHSPVEDGFWYAHCGWIFQAYRPNFRRYGTWVLKDKTIVHVSKNYVVYSLLGLVIPGVLLGWMGVLWAGFLRIFLCIHMTWFVNSLCHYSGSRAYPATKDNSKNNALVALFTFGEGLHNNHHRYLQMPFFAHRWYEMDIGKWVLLALHKIGLVWDFKMPKTKVGTDPVSAQ